MLTEVKEFKGFWFIPGKESENVPGVLRFNPDDLISLELLGDITHFDNSHSLLFKRREYPLIFGEDSDGKKITLIECSRGPSSSNYSSRFPLVSYRPNYILHGMHINSIEQNYFNKVEVQIPLLLDWINLYPTTETFFFGKDNNINGFEISCNLETPGMEINVPLFEDLTLRLSPYGFYSDTFLNEIKIYQGYKLSFESSQLKSILWYNKQIQNFLVFLNFATLKNVLITNKYFFSPRVKNKDQTVFPISCYQLQDIPKQNNKRGGNLFSYNSIQHEFTDIIKKWYSFDSEMRPILNHLIKSIQPKKYFDSGDFLVVVQALEGYHRRFKNEKELKLKKRLQNLVFLFNDIKGVQSLDIDYETIANTRHYYSHFFSLDDKNKIFEGVELYKETKKLKVLLTCCVLSELGISTLKINNMISD